MIHVPAWLKINIRCLGNGAIQAVFAHGVACRHFIIPLWPEFNDRESDAHLGIDFEAAKQQRRKQPRSRAHSQLYIYGTS